MDYRKYKDEKKVLLRVYPERPEKYIYIDWWQEKEGSFTGP